MQVSARDRPKTLRDDTTQRTSAAAERAPVSRLQLGVSRFEILQRQVLPYFSGKSWLHYGSAGEFRKPGNPLRRALRELKQRVKHQATLSEIEAAYASTNFAPWMFSKGDRLDIADGQIEFIFAEHFFEHLFFDEAVALLRECRRVLAPTGLVRIAVPDADLRTYEAPEPVGYPTRSMPFTDPTKHKTRWSVYMLKETLELVGFRTHPLAYCTKAGDFVAESPNADHPFYRDCTDPLVFTLDYVQRPKSLIVDARASRS